MTPEVAVGRRFVSRGGEKLDGALDALGVDVRGLRALDAGASTGGFTDCLLARGAREVVAVDVAYGQLAWSLRTDDRVKVHERTNVRLVEPGDLGEPVDLVVADLAFISLVSVADALLGCSSDQAQLLVLVKPQFELPRDRVPRGGVVRDQQGWLSAMQQVADAYRARGCAIVGAVAAHPPGPKGNREFFLHILRSGTDAGDEPIERAVREVG